MRTDATFMNNLKDPKSVLTIIEILILLGTVVYVFAVMQVKIDAHESAIQRHSTIIQNNIDRQRETYVRQDVFAEQYRSILEKLERIERKLDDNP